MRINGGIVDRPWSNEQLCSSTPKVYVDEQGDVR